MRKERLVFAAIGVAGIGAALLQPTPLSPHAERARIEAIMRSHGYAPTGQTAIGNALTVMKFSSPACADVRVVPVSILLQERTLLKKAETAGRDGIFIYRREAWKNTVPTSANLSYLSEQFLQTVRLKPNPAVDTMLYVVSPKNCAAPAINWTQFWSRAPTI